MIRTERANKGFTLVELMIVVFILSITALIAVPMLSSASSFQLNAAENMVASDLEYARSLAISTQKPHSVVFDPTKESYKLIDNYGTQIDSPQGGKNNYAVDFTKKHNLARVNIKTVSFDGSLTITFDYLGSPYKGTGTSTPLNSGTVTLEAGDGISTVNVEAITGYITISQ